MVFSLEDHQPLQVGQRMVASYLDMHNLMGQVKNDTTLTGRRCLGYIADDLDLHQHRVFSLEDHQPLQVGQRRVASYLDMHSSIGQVKNHTTLTGRRCLGYVADDLDLHQQRAFSLEDHQPLQVGQRRVASYLDMHNSIGQVKNHTTLKGRRS